MERTSRIEGSRVERLTRSGAFLFAVVAAGYATGSQLSFSWFGADGTNASFFPAAGVTLGALVLVSRRRWPIVLAAAGLAELTLDLYHDIALAPTLGYVAANLAQPLVGALLLGAVARRPDISRTYDLIAFLGAAVTVAPAVGGALGASTYVFVDGGSGWARFAGEWWVGDGLGVLVVGSAILAVGTGRRERLGRTRLLTGLLVALAAVLATQAVFRFEKFAFVYVPIVLLAALAFRVGTRGVALTGAAIAFVAAEATAGGSRYWEALEISASTGLLYLQLALGVVIGSALALAAEISERERTASKLARAETEREATKERLALYDAERAARERAQLLERNAGHLAAAATQDEVASSTVDDLTAAGIPIVAVEALRHHAGHRVVSVLAVSGLPPELVLTFEDYPLEADTPGAEAIRSAKPVEIANGDAYDRRFPGTAELRRQRDTQSVFAVPMRSASGEILGAVSGAAPEPAWFDETRRALVIAVAEQTGLALERASLLEREREARARAELDERLAVELQHVTATLAAAETAQDVAQAVVAQLIPALGGMGGSLFVVDDDAAALRLVDHASYPEHVIEANREIPLARRTPPSDAIRTAAPLLFPDLDSLRAAYPDIVEEIGFEGPQYGRAWAHVPLFAGRRAVGMLIMAYAEPQPFDRRQRDTLASICDAVAQALRRTELYEAEREARLRAELLQSHAGRLAAAVTIHDVARTTIAGLESAEISSAWVQLLRGGRLELLESAGVPDENLERYRSYDLDTTTPPAEAARTGAVVDVTTGAELDARFPASAAGRRLNPFESLVSVPLVAAAGRILGVLTFTSRRPNWLNESRRLLALGLAEQCGLALERAELRAEAEWAAADAALLAHLGEVLERATGLSDRAEALVRALVEQRSALAVVHALDEEGPRIIAEAASGLELDAERTRCDRLAAAALAEDGPTADEGATIHLHAVPLRARNRALGVLTIGVPAEDASPLTTVMAQRVATRAALAFDNALLYEHERDVSHSLQMGLLGGALEEAPGTVAATAYRAGTTTLEVGGDWYDQFTLPDGRLALVVGDVVGHGLEAAVAMGQLRGAVRALAPVGSPREVLERLDQLVDTLSEAAMATLAYAVLDTHTGALTYACAGHPPPLIVPAEGDARLLWEGRSAPLGSSFGGRREEARDELGEADTIVLYTDGLVERRTDSVTAGLERLVATVAGRAGDPPGELVAAILDACLAGTRQEDDVCVLAVRRLASVTGFERTFPASPSEVADLRRALAAWLEGVELDPSRRRDTVLAVAEAAANAAEHAYGFDGAGLVRVNARVESGELTISIEDEGTWREPRSDTERGRGRSIMEALMEDVAIDPGEDGTVVRMRVSTTMGAQA